MNIRKPPRETISVRPPTVAAYHTLVEATLDQGNVNVFPAGPAFEQGVIAWSSPDGHPMPVRITFACPIFKSGPAVTVPKSSGPIGGALAAVIEYAAMGSIATVVIVDWPMNGRSVVLMASRITVRARTRLPGLVTAASQGLYPIQLSDAGPVTSRDFAPMTYTNEAEDFVPASPGVLTLVIPQNATALMLNARVAASPYELQFTDDIGDPTLIRRFGGASAATEMPEQPSPIPAYAQTVAVRQPGAVPYDVRPVWLIDL